LKKLYINKKAEISKATPKVPFPPHHERAVPYIPIVTIAETLSTAQQEIDIFRQFADEHKIQKCGLMQRILSCVWGGKSCNLQQI